MPLEQMRCQAAASAKERAIAFNAVVDLAVAVSAADNAAMPDEDRVYRNYVETCRRLGVEPVP